MERTFVARTTNPALLDQQGQGDFAAGSYASAMERFQEAAEAYAAQGDLANRAEQMNNLAVTLLRVGRAREALKAVTGTEAVFAARGDARRQGIAMNNQAAALEALGRADEAVAAYEKAARFLGEAGERGLQSEALKAAATADLRRGRVASSGLRMLGALSANPDPNPLERLLRALLRRIR